MKTSIAELLKRQGTKEEQTIYGAYPEEIRRFAITAGDFFCLEPVKDWDGNVWVQGLYERLLEKKKERTVYRSLCSQKEALSKEIRRIKEADQNGYGHIEELRALRRARKGVEDAMKDLQSCYEAEVLQKLSRDLGTGRMELFSYKNTACVGSFSDLEHQIPKLSRIRLPWIRRTPLLLAGIRNIRRAVDQNCSIGIVGGPCLFGTYEVEILVRHRDGSLFTFDFSSGRNYDRQHKKGPEFADHVELYRGDIVDIDFQDWKESVTSQEYDSLEAVFAFGAALGAKVAVPIPDLSYLKYLATVLMPMDPEFRMYVLDKFRIHTRRIADLYLDLIRHMRKKYPQVETEVLHERNESLCRLFHEKREIYFSKSGLIHRMTAKRQKTDAIFDYISMLALPYYIWGTPQVIQVDNLDETDSYRKCRRVHKDAFILSAVLYPERLSADGQETIFNARLEYKEYLDRKTWQPKSGDNMKERKKEDG